MWLRAITSFFLVIHCVLSWHEWLRAWAMYGNLTHDTVLAFISQIYVLVQQTNKDVYYSTKILSFVLVKLVWCVSQKLHLYALLPLKMADFYCTCRVPRLMQNLHSPFKQYTMHGLQSNNISTIHYYYHHWKLKITCRPPTLEYEAHVYMPWLRKLIIIISYLYTFAT